MSESLNQHEPTPQPSDRPAAWDLVLSDIHERDAMGTAKYKVRLTPFNGRNFIKDAYQEALDLTVYLRGAVYEIETLQAKIAELERQLAEAKEDTARLDGVLKKVRELIGGTASIILLPGRKTLNNADVSACVVTDARKACEAIDAAQKEAKHFES